MAFSKFYSDVINELTYITTLKFEFFINHKPLNHNGRLIRIDSTFDSTKKNCSVKREVLTWGANPSHTQ
jgi:hypothetical protein